MSVNKSKIFSQWLGVAIIFGLAACGGSGSDSSTPSESARFTFDCDLQGLNGVLTMDVEVVQSSGLVWGSGPNPQITAVIGLAGATYFTSGDLRSATAYYTFTGENLFADFTEIQPPTLDRFRVQWSEQGQTLIMIINPFGPGPTQHVCQTTSAVLL
jgi:hypothetical protein